MFSILNPWFDTTDDTNGISNQFSLCANLANTKQHRKLNQI